VIVAVSGGGGAIGYALAFRVAAGELLGAETPVELRLLDGEPGLAGCAGLAMELADCGFPLLTGVSVTARAEEAFDGASWVLALGAVPRAAVTSREAWCSANGRLYAGLGTAVAARAAADVRVLVVGNPCAANCLVARSHAPEVPDDRWFALTRLDENRARAHLAAAAGVPAAAVTNLAVWGNHSATRYPDVRNARIGGRPALDALPPGWHPALLDAALAGRSAAVQAARRGPAAASAAAAVLDTVRALRTGTPAGDWLSVATVSQGGYGVPAGLVFGHPVTSDGTAVRVVEGLPHDGAARRRLAASVDELLAERAALADVLPAAAGHRDHGSQLDRAAGAPVEAVLTAQQVLVDQVAAERRVVGVPGAQHRVDGPFRVADARLEAGRQVLQHHPTFPAGGGNAGQPAVRDERAQQLIAFGVGIERYPLRLGQAGPDRGLEDGQVGGQAGAVPADQTVLGQRRQGAHHVPRDQAAGLGDVAGRTGTERDRGVGLEPHRLGEQSADRLGVHN
jgi:malate dehydrogenase